MEKSPEYMSEIQTEEYSTEGFHHVTSSTILDIREFEKMLYSTKLDSDKLIGDTYTELVDSLSGLSSEPVDAIDKKLREGFVKCALPTLLNTLLKDIPEILEESASDIQGIFSKAGYQNIRVISESGKVSDNAIKYSVTARIPESGLREEVTVPLRELCQTLLVDYCNILSEAVGQIFMGERDTDGPEEVSPKKAKELVELLDSMGS